MVPGDDVRRVRGGGSAVRAAALGLVQQLVLSTGGDDDMGTLLGLMHTAPPTALTLKTDILKVGR